MNALPTKTKDALVSQFNQLHREFITAAKACEPLLVQQVKQAAEMGVIIKELLGIEAVTKSRLAGWLEANPGRLCETHVDWLMNYVSVANKTGDVNAFADVPRTVAQMTFQCAGILPEETGREAEQKSHALPPCTVVWNLRMSLQKQFDSLVADLADFDDDQRQTVKVEIKKAITYLEQLEAKL